MIDLGRELERPVAVRGAEARRVERSAREIAVRARAVAGRDLREHLRLQSGEDGVLALKVVGERRGVGQLARLDVAEVGAVPGLEVGERARLEPAAEEDREEDDEENP